MTSLSRVFVSAGAAVIAAIAGMAEAREDRPSGSHRAQNDRDTFQLEVVILVVHQAATLKLHGERPELTVTLPRKTRRIPVEPWLHRLFWRELERIPAAHMNGWGVGDPRDLDGFLLRISGTVSGAAFSFEGGNAVPEAVRWRLLPILQAIRPFTAPLESIYAEALEPALLYPLKPEAVWPGRFMEGLTGMRRRSVSGSKSSAHPPIFPPAAIPMPAGLTIQASSSLMSASPRRGTQKFRTEKCPWISFHPGLPNSPLRSRSLSPVRQRR